MRIKQITVLLTVLAVILSGCQFGMIETVQIKADPTIEFALGTRANVLSDTLDLDSELTSALDEINTDPDNPLLVLDEDGIPYDVDGAPGTDDVSVKSLRMEMDLFDYSINDFAGENLNLDAITQDIEEVSFTIPEISSSQSFATGFEPIALPLAASIPTVSIPTIPEIDGSATVETPTAITATGYDSMTFASGTLSIDVAVTGGSGTQTVVINNARIMDGATEVLVTNSPDVTADGTITFALTGETLPSSFTIEFTLTVSGAVPVNTFSMDLTTSFSGDTTISAATGITVDESISDSVTVPLGNADLVSATIATGGVDIDLVLDPSWTNLDTTMNWTLSQGATVLGSAAGITVNNADALPGAVEIDLAGVALGGADLTLDYTIDVKTTSGETSNFSVTSGVPEVSGTAAAGITSFDSLVLVVPDMSLAESIVQDVDSSVTDSVSSVTFANTANVTMAINNNLPPDTNIEVTLTSDVLDISGMETFGAGTNNATWSILASKAYTLDLTAANADFTDTDASGEKDINMDVAVAISGYDSATSQLTLGNVNANQTYSISGTVSTDLSIDSVTISGVNTGMTEFPDVTGGEDPLDLSMLNDFLPNTITFPGIAPQLLLNLDTNGENMDLNVYLLVEYKWMEDTDADGEPDTEQTKSLEIYGTDTDSDGVPETYEPFDQDDTSVALPQIGTMINDRAYDIVFHYDVNLTSATISVSGDDDQRIQTAVAADIPLLLNSAGDTRLTIDNEGVDEDIISAFEEDVFGRTADNDDISQYLEFLTAASINVTYENAVSNDPANQLLSLRLDVIEDTNPAGESNFTYSLPLEITDARTGSINIALDQADFDRIVADTTFAPRFELYMLDGNHYLPQGFDMDISASISVQSEIDTTLEELTGGDE